MVWKLLIPLSQRFLMREPWGDDAEVATPAALGPEELDLLVGACSFPAAGQLIRD